MPSVLSVITYASCACLFLFAALDHASSIVRHAGGAVRAEPLVRVQQALQLHHQVRLGQEEPSSRSPAAPG